MEDGPVDAHEPWEPAAAAPPASYCMLDLVNHDGKSIHYAFMYNGRRFYVTIAADKLRGKGLLLDKFSYFAESLDDLDSLFRFEDWVLGALHDIFARLAPEAEERGQASASSAAGEQQQQQQQQQQHMTLMDFYGCATYAVELVNEGGELRPVEMDYDARLHVDASPRARMIDLEASPAAGRDANKEDEAEAASRNGRGGRKSSILGQGGHILRAALPKVPYILASDLERLDDDSNPWAVPVESDTPPKKVRRISTGQVFFFKGAFKHHLRELELLEQIYRHRSMFVPPFRTSRLAGLVLWDDDPCSLMGFLLEYVDGRSLAARMADADPAQRMKWISEVEVTLRRLHECGIVWGAVAPESVIINADGNAVITDLGAGGEEGLEHIAAEDRQTVRGDMLGLEHMRMELGLIDQSLYSAALGP